MPTSYFGDCFRGATVLVTGHTGFKGSWLSCWLHTLGAQVVGASNDIPTVPSHFETIGLAKLADDRRVDIRDLKAVKALVKEVEPDFVFHLAAQPIVHVSYEDPMYTVQTNTMGTFNVLTALREANNNCIAVLITSDKCYENHEWIWGYRENDRLGGKDIYSASKAAAELLVRAYVRSFLQDAQCSLRIGIGRAGNVIGGGDWAPYRLIPDCVRAWSDAERVVIRNPASTRPWQHVLEPLSGYLCLAQHLALSGRLHGEAFNFGPSTDINHSVSDLISAIAADWQDARWCEDSSAERPYEAGLLKLNCDKAAQLLHWYPILSFAETVTFTANWYKSYYHESTSHMLQHTLDQIDSYCQLAAQRSRLWAGQQN